MTDLDASHHAAAELIREADALVIGAGAGMGVDSGLPDFRGNAGFWRAYPALAHAGLDFVQVASPDTFERDPTLAWGFYGHRLNLYRQTAPHEGFAILRGWASKMVLGAHVFTSNVDGHFQKACFAEDLIHECHGSIQYLQCVQCDAACWSARNFEPVVDESACRLLSPLPYCPQCGALARPNVLMFGDWNWQSGRANLQKQKEAAWLQALDRADARVVVIEIGAGTDVPSVRHFSAYLARVCRARLVRINPGESAVAHREDVAIAQGALTALQGIAAAL